MKKNPYLCFILLLFYFNNISYAQKPLILIVYYSKSGNTKAMAEAVATGAVNNENVMVRVVSVDEAKIHDVEAADAIIIGSPVYNANTAPEI